MQLADNKNTMEKELRVAIISPYPPPKKKHAYGSGVTSYTKNLVNALKSVVTPNMKIFVIADKLNGVPHIYNEDGVYVIRVFSKNAMYVFQIFKQLCRIKPNIVHIQHEYFLYGGLLSALMFPLLTLLSRLIAKKVIITMHHGIFPLSNLNDENFRKENGLKGPAILLKLGLILVTKMIVLFAHKIIVHEPFMKKYLIIDYKVPIFKIKIIPHGVEDARPLPKDLAKELVGLKGKKIILYFGYLTGYKGIELLVEAYKRIVERVPDTVLIIAGGPHPRLIRNQWYMKWLKELMFKIVSVNKQIQGKGRIILTGYVAEDELPTLFSAADLVVLPYKSRIGASGPEALAIAFEKPYYIPKDPEECTRITVKELSERIFNMLSSLYEFRVRVKYVKNQRSWINTVRLYLDIYLGKNFKTLGRNRGC